MMRAPALLLIAFPLVAGCAGPKGGYPSLAPRPIEKVGFAEPPTPVPSPAAREPALDTRIAGATRESAKAAQAFDTAATRAERLAKAARGDKPGGERWLEAQTALAELDSLRSAYGDTAGALEDLAAERAQALAPAYPALERAIEEQRAVGEAQTRRIDAISATLPQ
jgi:hypothetical protein